MDGHAKDRSLAVAAPIKAARVTSRFSRSRH